MKAIAKNAGFVLAVVAVAILAQKLLPIPDAIREYLP